MTHSLYELNFHSSANYLQMPAPRAGQKIVIFAPHPDDEALGCSGYIQQAVAAGASVHVVLMTNGEYPELSVVLFEETIRLRPTAFIKLGEIRQRETLSALRVLGVPVQNVTFLGYPNEYLDQLWLPNHWLPSNPVRSARTRATASPYPNSMTPGAIYCGQSLLHDVETVLQREQPDVVITLHPNDMHVDHWPTYAFVRFALNELAAAGMPFAKQCQVFTYLIHRSHWPVPRRYRPWLNLDPPDALVKNQETEWNVLPLTVAQVMKKRDALAQYKTQGGAIDPLLLSFVRANELFGAIPERSWQNSPEVPLRTVSREPAADIDAAVFNPNADLTNVAIGRKDDHLMIVLHTRKNAARKIGYHFSIDSGGKSAQDRIIVRYDWHGKTVSGMIVQHGELRKIPSSSILPYWRGKETGVEVPWPLDDQQTFFMVRAWTTAGRRNTLIDRTAVPKYLITK